MVVVGSFCSSGGKKLADNNSSTCKSEKNESQVKNASSNAPEESTSGDAPDVQLRGESSTDAAFHEDYERPDGEVVFYNAGEPSLAQEDDREFDASIFDDFNLVPLKHVSSSPSVFIPLNEDDYRTIQNGYRVAAEKVKSFPMVPGVYLMKDANDKIIYIGKAKSLKKRVSQYFLRPQSGKVAAMVSHVDHFDTIVVSSNKESFILEMNLIQTHYPRYNIMLMDDSHYPYIGIRKGGDPYLRLLRSSKDPKYYYFGPFPNAGDCVKTIELLNKIFPTRKCKNIPDKPCLYYQMGQCLAPCINKIDPKVYEKLYDDIKAFLNGDTAEAEAALKEKMLKAAERLAFEEAAEYKKTLDALKAVTEKQRVEIIGDKVNRDVFAYAEREGYRSLAILGRQCRRRFRRSQ